MAASAYLLSLLQRQYLLLVHGFQSRYPASWLVWEPGPWRAARSPAEAGALKTHLGLPGVGPRPVGSDALCFELQNSAGTLLVGRDPSSDVFINDLTLSRKHFLLRFEGASWSVAVHHESSTITRLDDQQLEVGVPTALRAGASIVAGAVALTFYDSSGFLTRLKGENQKSSG